MLKKLKQIMRSERQVPLKELAEFMRLDRSSTKQLLLYYLRTGQIEKLPDGTTCDHCTSCKPESIEIYRWVGRSESSIPLQLN